MYFRHDTLCGRPNGRIACDPAKPILAQDRREVSPKSIFKRAKRLEGQYAAKLRRIAKHIGDIVREFPEGTIEASIAIRAAMERYSIALEPWAQAVGSRMVAEVASRDEANWRQVSARMGRALHKEILSAPTGALLRERLGDQVRLIKSLPIDAAERVHHETLKGISEGKRAGEIAKTIMETGSVSKSRADLIAVTEVARTSAALTEARARHVGSVQYVWRTAKDRDVRKDHRVLDGKVFSWSDPPVSDSRTGARAHPGCIYRCRCYAEPLL